MAENGDYAIGKILDELSDNQITPEEILKTFNSNNVWKSMHNLYTRAKKMSNINLLYGMWLDKISEENGARAERFIEKERQNK
jgi:hypothetical protein